MGGPFERSRNFMCFSLLEAQKVSQCELNRLRPADLVDM